MTVKELINILKTYNQDSEVWISDDSSASKLDTYQVYQTPGEVITFFDCSVESLHYNREDKQS